MYWLSAGNQRQIMLAAARVRILSPLLSPRAAITPTRPINSAASAPRCVSSCPAAIILSLSPATVASTSAEISVSIPTVGIRVSTLQEGRPREFNKVGEFVHTIHFFKTIHGLILL